MPLKRKLFVVVILFFVTANMMPSIFLTKSNGDTGFSVSMSDTVWESADMERSAFSSRDDFIDEVEYYSTAFGKTPSVFNFGLDAHAYANYFLMCAQDEFEMVFPVIGTSDTRQNTYTTGELRQVFYILSYSFSKYMIDTYGIDSFLSLYESDDLPNDYVTIYRKTFEDIKEEWHNYLESYSEPMTAEEIQKYVAELFDEHDYPYK